MRFNQLYPDAEVGFRSDEGFRKGRRVLRCIVCQRRTAWFSERVCLYFCSTDCWENYPRSAESHRESSAEAPHAE